MIAVRIAGKPRDNDCHTWADFFELLAVVNLDRSCTLNGAIDRVMDSPEEEALDEPDEIPSQRLLVESSPGAAERERARQHFLDAIQLCMWRSSEYGDNYPFVIAADRSEMRLKDALTDPMYSYLFLLLCGSQPFIVRDNHQLTDGFELFASSVLTNLMPAGSQVFLFGKATSTKYSGTKHGKLAALAADVDGKLHLAPGDYRDGDRGDGGLDLVAWHDLGDRSGNKLVAFAQCACSRSDWRRKQAEIVPDVFGAHLTTSPWWMPFVFIPMCFRATTGKWAVPGDVKRVVLVDRLRMMNNCRDFGSTNAASGARTLVEAVFASEEVV